MLCNGKEYCVSNLEFYQIYLKIYFIYVMSFLDLFLPPIIMLSRGGLGLFYFLPPITMPTQFLNFFQKLVNLK